MMLILRRLLAAMAMTIPSLVTAGCGGAGEPGAGETTSELTVSDSAGIEIVETSGSVWTDATRWQFGPDALFVIGGDVDDEESLYDVGEIAPLSDGRFVVAHGSRYELLWFAPDGTLLTRAGAEGEGPGEFRYVHRVFALPGDSVVAPDGRLDRISVFDSEGSLAHTAKLDMSGASGFASPVALLPDRTLIGRPGFGFSSDTERRLHRDTLPLPRFRLDGSFAGSVGVFPLDENWVFNYRGSTAGGSLPWGKEPVIAAADQGFWYGSADLPQLSLHSPGGETLRILRWGRSAEPLTVEMIEDYKRRGRESSDDGPEARRETEDFLSQIPWPETVPAVSRLIVDSDGCLWVRPYRIWPAPPGGPWIVFAPDGRRLGTIEIPDPFELGAITFDRIYGVWTDDLDVETVRVFALDRG
jgi:hypothetical protein